MLTEINNQSISSMIVSGTLHKIVCDDSKLVVKRGDLVGEGGQESNVRLCRFV